MSYNLTAIGQNTTGLLSLTQTTNDVLLFGWGGLLLILGICTVIFMAFLYSTQDSSKSIIATLFIGTLLSMLFQAVDLIDNSLVTVAFLIMTALAVAFSGRKL